MTRFSVQGSSVAVVLAAIVACASSDPVSVTKTASAVQGCQKIGDVAVDSKTPASVVTVELVDAARLKGANTVLVAEDGARTGTAYRCTTPAVASR